MLSDAIRFLSVDMIERARSGHPGMPLGMADILTVLATKFLTVSPMMPSWPNRDRLIISNGHGSAGLYALMYLMGYPDVSLDELKNFRQWGSRTAGHPEKNLIDGIDFSTGPLGQGLASGVGMAIGAKMMQARFGSDIINHKVYVTVGDGCLMEGISEEAISLAGHLKLNNLIVLWDDNGITIDGSTAIATHTDQPARFKANGWTVITADGTNVNEIERALSAAQESDQPVFIDFKTIIGFGSDKAGTSACHGAPLGAESIKKLRENRGWTCPPFVIPDALLAEWRAFGGRHESTRAQWESHLRASGKEGDFYAFLRKEISFDVESYLKQVVSEKPALATRKASQNALNVLTVQVANLVGGSADLTGSNLTATTVSKPITAEDFSGNYIEYGIREHAMGAIMNGLAAYGGFIPYGGTFFTFMDYMKPAIRLGALMENQEIFVLTHDSIGVGEDGPTHQPIEQLATLRAMPNFLMFRPCDSVEVMESYEIALKSTKTPVALALSRQSVPTIRTDIDENKTARGGYVIYGEKTRDVTLIATGTEVSLAIEASRRLWDEGIHATVVSMPCMALFDQQDSVYRTETLGAAPRIAVEAAASFGWHKYADTVIGLDHFGASAPASTLYQRYGLTPDHLIDEVKKVLGKA